jgi:ankyrin repeat protein
VSIPARREYVQLRVFRFLLAYLHLGSLVGKPSAKAVRTALVNLRIGSGAYDSAYTAAMHRIESQVPDQADLGRQAITWIMHARRQLTTLEIQEALGVEIGQRELDQDNLSDVDDIISACAGLVTLDVETDVLRLVHYTTQENFDRTRQEWFPDAEPTITVTCITYLSFDTYGEGRNPLKSALNHIRSPQAGLYTYATRYWGCHAKKAPSTLADVVRFLRRPSHVTTTVEALAKYDRRLNEDVLGPPTSGLHISAYFGLEAVARTILEETSKPDFTNSNDSTPLMVAALRGHESVVELLLSWNACVERSNYYGYTALYMAVCGTHESIIRILLAHHALTNMKPSRSRGVPESALDVAIRSGSETTVGLLIQAGADANLKSSGSTPLHDACQGGYEAITRLLVNAGAEIDSFNYEERTPLSIACLRADENITRILLEAGANVNYWRQNFYRDRYSRSPLFCACTLSSRCQDSERREAVVKLLLDAGADTTRTDAAGRTVFQRCVKKAREGEKGYDGLIGLLRDHGAQDEPRGLGDSSGRSLSPQALPLRIQDAK